MNLVHVVRCGALVLGMSLFAVPAFAQAQGGSGAGGTMGSISVPAGHTPPDGGASTGNKQNHHCKLPDGTMDMAKTHKECTAAKGKWTKDAPADSTAK